MEDFFEEQSPLSKLTNLDKIRRKLIEENWAHRLPPAKGSGHKVQNKTLVVTGFDVRERKNGDEVLVVQYQMERGEQPKPTWEYFVQPEVLPYIVDAMERKTLKPGENYSVQVEIWTDHRGRTGNRWVGFKAR